MSGLPPALREAVFAFCEISSAAEIAQRAKAQSLDYRAGDGSPTTIAARTDIAAYLTTRLPATFAAIRAALAAASERAPVFQPASILDFGAGPGTASWAAADIWPGIAAITMEDRNPRFLEAATTLARYSPHTALQKPDVMFAQVPADRRKKYDLVVAAYVMSEVAELQIEDYAYHLWNLCRGLLVIVEPGTPRGFQRILRARQALLAQNAAIAAPCPGNVPCPMQADDWCHFAVRLPRSRDHMRAKNARVPYEDEKFSYIAAARDNIELTPPSPRIIAPVAAGKAGSRFRLCTTEGAAQVDIPRRDRAVYRQKSRKKWGDRF